MTRCVCAAEWCTVGVEVERLPTQSVLRVCNRGSKQQCDKQEQWQKAIGMVHRRTSGECRSLVRELERRLVAELEVLMGDRALIAREAVDGRSPNQAKTDGSGMLP